MNKDRILITGATGFLGQYLCRSLLSAGYKDILATTSRELDELNKIEGIRYVACDIVDIVELAKYVSNADIVIHCAGFISYHQRDYKKLFQINVTGTEHIVNLSIEYELKKLIYISSIAAIPKNINSDPLAEKDRFLDRNFSTNYGMTKYLGESHVWRAQAEGVDICILNPGLIIGTGDWSNGTPNFFTKLNEGLKYYPTGGSGIVYAADVAEFMISVLQGSAQADQYILVSENILYKDLFDQIADSLSKPKPRIAIKGLWKYMAFIVDFIQSTVLRHPRFLSKESMANISERKQFSNALSKEVEGFEYTPIKQAVEQIASEFKQTHK